jgi:hypothetical protein
MLQYVLLIIIVIVIIIIAVIRLKFKFWASQPVFHIYDLHHWLIPNHVIDNSLPNINKYVKLLDVETLRINDISDTAKAMVVKFICENYLDNYCPDIDDIFQYFSTFLGQSHVSLFLDNEFKQTSSQLSYNNRDVIGIITSRPLFLTFQGEEPFMVNYIDNLNVRKDKRKRDIAPNLIATHHYRIRHINNATNVSIFKREGEMTAIIPLTLYTSYEFDILDICAKKIYHSETLIKINKNNFNHFKTMVKSCTSKFKCILNIEQATLFKLLLLSKIVIYVLMSDTTPVCCYVLRVNPYISTDGIKYVDLISSINSAPLMESFFAGFQTVCRRESRKQKTNRINIDTIGDNCSLTREICSRHTRVRAHCPSAVFLCNYVHYSVNPEDCLFIY